MNPKEHNKSIYNKNAKRWAEIQADKKQPSYKYIILPEMLNNITQLDINNRVLCIGCGSGDECKYFQEKCTFVQGIDYSHELIKIAKYNNPEVVFSVCDFDSMDFDMDTYDLIFSNMTFHYSQDLERLITECCKSLRTGGQLLFSVLHPTWTATSKYGDLEILGKGPNEVIGDYLTEGWRRGFLTVIDSEYYFYHRKISTYVNTITKAGFVEIRVIEPTVSENAKKSELHYYNLRSKIPSVLIISARKA